MYQKFEGRKITWVSPKGEVRMGLVVGIDKNIGITIVAADDSTKEITCLDGPCSPVWKKDVKAGRYEAYHENYDAIFELSIKMIDSWVFESSKTVLLYSEDNAGGGANMQACSFR